MADPILLHAHAPTRPPAAILPLVAELAAAQPLAMGIAAFLLLYALLTLLLRLADRIDPPPVRARAVLRVEAPQARVWRFRKTA